MKKYEKYVNLRKNQKKNTRMKTIILCVEVTTVSNRQKKKSAMMSSVI